MNLKKIIKEELDDDWSWTQSEPNIWLSYQLLIFNETPTKEEIIKFIRDAFKSGLIKNEAIRTWELEGIEDEAEAIYDYCQQGITPYLRIDLNNGWLYYGSHIKDIVDKHPELRKIYFSEAKKYSIKESEEDDWKWVEETNINPPKTEEDLKDFIGWSFVWDTDNENHTGMWGYNGKEWKITKLEWGEVWFRDQNSGVDHVEDVGRFLTRIGEGLWVLVSPEGYLLDPQYNRTYNKNINESDEDFKWIEDVDPKDMTFRLGDVIKVHNVGDEGSFLNWLGDFSENYLNNNYGEFIIGEIVGIDDKRIEIQERYTDNYIFFPTYLDMENVRNGDEGSWTSYPNLDMYYEILGDEN